MKFFKVEKFELDLLDKNTRKKSQIRFYVNFIEVENSFMAINERLKIFQVGDSYSEVKEKISRKIFKFVRDDLTSDVYKSVKLFKNTEAENYDYNMEFEKRMSEFYEKVKTREFSLDINVAKSNNSSKEFSLDEDINASNLDEYWKD